MVACPEGAAEFAADDVFPDEKSGLYMTGPSYSPEKYVFRRWKGIFPVSFHDL